MASRREHNQQKSRERKRLRDKDRARVAQERRQKEAALAQVSMEQALTWAEGECYLGQHWHEQGPHLWAVFTRTHPSGRVCAALFELDLAEEGVQDVELLMGLRQEQLMARLAALSQEHPLVVVGAELVVHAVRTAQEWGQKQDFEQPDELPEATRLFGEFRLPPGLPDLKVGREAGQRLREPEPAAPQGLWGRIRSGLGF